VPIYTELNTISKIEKDRQDALRRKREEQRQEYYQNKSRSRGGSHNSRGEYHLQPGGEMPRDRSASRNRYAQVTAEDRPSRSRSRQRAPQQVIKVLQRPRSKSRDESQSGGRQRRAQTPGPTTSRAWSATRLTKDDELDNFDYEAEVLALQRKIRRRIQDGIAAEEAGGGERKPRDKEGFNSMDHYLLKTGMDDLEGKRKRALARRAVRQAEMNKERQEYQAADLRNQLLVIERQNASFNSTQQMNSSVDSDTSIDARTRLNTSLNSTTSKDLRSALRKSSTASTRSNTEQPQKKIGFDTMTRILNTEDHHKQPKKPKAEAYYWLNGNIRMQGYINQLKKRLQRKAEKHGRVADVSHLENLQKANLQKATTNISVERSQSRELKATDKKDADGNAILEFDNSEEYAQTYEREAAKLVPQDSTTEHITEASMQPSEEPMDTDGPTKRPASSPVRTDRSSPEPSTKRSTQDSEIERLRKIEQEAREENIRLKEQMIEFEKQQLEQTRKAMQEAQKQSAEEQIKTAQLLKSIVEDYERLRSQPPQPQVPYNPYNMPPMPPPDWQQQQQLQMQQWQQQQWHQQQLMQQRMQAPQQQPLPPQQQPPQTPSRSFSQSDSSTQSSSRIPPHAFTSNPTEILNAPLINTGNGVFLRELPVINQGPLMNQNQQAPQHNAQQDGAQQDNPEHEHDAQHQ
jgi:hypothetical protein